MTMTAPDGSPCPICDGPWMPDHPCGVLNFKHENDCSARNAEDGRAAADVDMARGIPDGHPNRRQIGPYAFTRPATPTECQLLDAIGFDVPDTELTTHVNYPGNGAALRTRTWPNLRSRIEEPA